MKTSLAMYSIKDKSRSVLLQALVPSRGNNLGIVNFSIDVLAEIALELTGKPNKPRKSSEQRMGAFQPFPPKSTFIVQPSRRGSLTPGWSACGRFRQFKILKLLAIK